MSTGPGQNGPIARLRPGGAGWRLPGRPHRPAPSAARPPVSSPAARPKLVEWHQLTPEQRQGEWTELLDWVTWLHDRYELSVEERLPTCWPLHPGLIEELRALKAWRYEIYGPHTTASSTQNDTTPTATTGNSPAAEQPERQVGQAARYWHAELRLLIQAATTWYALGCRAGHRDAPHTAEDADLRGHWRDADHLAGIPAELLISTHANPPHAAESDARSVLDHDATLSERDWISETLMRNAVHDGQARPLSQRAHDFVHLDGSWWIPAPSPHASPPPLGDDEPLGWQRVHDPQLHEQLDQAADRIGILDAYTDHVDDDATPSI